MTNNNDMIHEQNDLKESGAVEELKKVLPTAVGDDKEMGEAALPPIFNLVKALNNDEENKHLTQEVKDNPLSAIIMSNLKRQSENKLSSIPSELKVLLSEMYNMIKPDVEEFFADKKNLSEKYQNLYLSTQKRLEGCMKDLKTGRKRLEEAEKLLREKTSQFEKMPLSDLSYNIQKYEAEITPANDSVGLWNKYVEVKIREINRIKFFKTKVFAREKTITTYIVHATIVKVMCQVLLEKNYECPYTSEDDKYNHIEKLRKNILELDEIKNIPAEITDEYLTTIAEKNGLSYVRAKTDEAKEFKALSHSLIKDTLRYLFGEEKYETWINKKWESETLMVKRSYYELCDIYKALKNNGGGLDIKTYQMYKEKIGSELPNLAFIIESAQTWIKDQFMSLVDDNTEFMDNLKTKQSLSIFKRKIQPMSNAIFKDEGDRGAVKLLLVLSNTTLVDAMELVLNIM